ncbi:MAG: RIP metalloprotease RseP [Parcubacteria group bacterium]|nr:RIP metalloprotease RseP [Parcubacteria group bacterium]
MFTTLLIFIIILGILVFVHELGHFSAAKAFGVKVEEFAIGFPPRLFGFTRGGTKYFLNLIPLGGYVNIKGESGEHQTDPDSFSAKPVWQRAVIISAGVAMNIVTAFLFIFIGFGVGLPLPLDEDNPLPPQAKVRDVQIQIVQVLEGSPAFKVGLKRGDGIVKVDNQTFTEITDLQNYLHSGEGRSVLATIRRGSELKEFEVGTEKLGETQQYGLGVGLVKSGIVSYPLPTALWESAKRVVFVTREIFVSLGIILKNFFSGMKVDLPVAGPVGIAVITGEVSQLGFIYLLQFIALLSINLAIINILPFPALDGARLAFLAIEKVRGRPFNQQVEHWIHTVGFSLLMVLMVLVTYKDFVRYGGRIWNALF